MHLSQFLSTYVEAWEQPEFDPKGGSRFGYQTSIVPATYLNYSQMDLDSDLSHRHINALTNAKRAIDCQLDNIFDAFGLRKKKNFPEKLETISELGLLAPRIVRKVVRVRNLLEHEYYDPSHEEVEDAVDVTTLFLEATSRPFRSFLEDYFVADKASAQNPTAEQLARSVQYGDNPIHGYTFTESFFVQYDQETSTFWIDCVHENKQVEEIEIENTHPFYKRMIRFSFDYDFDYYDYSNEEIGEAFVSLMRELADEL